MADPPPRRSRSRSPPRRAARGNRGGFRWKDSRSGENSHDRRDSGRRRDFRDRSRSPVRNRDDDRNRDQGRSRDQDRNRDRPRSPRRQDSARKDEGEKEGEESSEQKNEKKKDKKPKAPKAAVGPGQELIVVHINDRLGTKTAVPCLPSDTVGQLKLMIAARIGRDSGQIMLRRQGERPFKDMLSLEDYGISNGVQLDLEIDTGD